MSNRKDLEECKFHFWDKILIDIKNKKGH